MTTVSFERAMLFPPDFKPTPLSLTAKIGALTLPILPPIAFWKLSNRRIGPFPGPLLGICNAICWYVVDSWALMKVAGADLGENEHVAENFFKGVFALGGVSAKLPSFFASARYNGSIWYGFFVFGAVGPSVYSMVLTAKKILVGINLLKEERVLLGAKGEMLCDIRARELERKPGSSKFALGIGSALAVSHLLAAYMLGSEGAKEQFDSNEAGMASMGGWIVFCSTYLTLHMMTRVTQGIARGLKGRVSLAYTLLPKTTGFLRTISVGLTLLSWGPSKTIGEDYFSGAFSYLMQGALMTGASMTIGYAMDDAIEDGVSFLAHSLGIGVKEVENKWKYEALVSYLECLSPNEFRAYLQQMPDIIQR